MPADVQARADALVRELGLIDKGSVGK